MTKYNGLLGDMKAIFGSGFGESQPLAEDVDPSLTEKTRPFPQGAPYQAKPDRAARAQGAHGGAAIGTSGKSHNPFKNSPNLGFGPGDPDQPDDGGERHHDQVKCWNCDCGDIYTQGCQCVGTGATKDCPRGEIKNVKIKRGYRQKYNKMYHAWRRKKRGTSDGVTDRNAGR